MSELKSAIRSLLNTPGFTTLAVITIAVGIAANTALFSVFDRLVLNPVALPHNLESPLRRQFLPFFRDERHEVRFDIERDLRHFVVRRHFQVELRSDDLT